MFGLSRDGGRVFLHQPEAGVAVPLVLEFAHNSLDVRVPPMDELENDYAIYDDVEAILQDVTLSQRDLIQDAVALSRQASAALRDRMGDRKLTVAELRGLVEEYVRASLARPSAPGALAPAGRFLHIKLPNRSAIAQKPAASSW